MANPPMAPHRNAEHRILETQLPTTFARWLDLGARLVLALVFLFAAVPKLLDPADFASDVDNYRLLPPLLVGIVATGLPVVELVVAAALIPRNLARGSAVVAASLLAAFTVGMAQAMTRGIDLECGCFGSGASSEVGWVSLARNATLFATAIFVAFYPYRRRG